MESAFASKTKLRYQLAVRFLCGVLVLFSGVEMSLAAPPYTIDGTAFVDTDGDGTQDTNEKGVAGLTVTLYSPAGAVGAPVNTDANGDYSITAGVSGPYRLEFGNVPFYLNAGRGSSGTLTRFLIDGDSTANLALIDPPKYVEETNPLTVTTCFVFGQYNGGNAAGTALLTVPYDATGHDFSGTMMTASFQGAELAQIQDIGATYGIAWQSSTSRMYVGAYHKRYSGYGPNGPDAIYQYDTSGTLTGVLELDTFLPGSNTAGADVHDFSGNPVYDIGTGNVSYDGVGKRSFGDLEMSADMKTLYVMNLFDRKIYAFDVTDGVTANATLKHTPGSGTTYGWNAPDATGASRHRPFGLAWHKGKLWVGSVDQNASNAYVHSLDPSGTTFTLEVTVPINFTRQAVLGTATQSGRAATWRAWQSNPANVSYIVTSGGEIGYPQPMLSDIEFDGDDMILGFRDRFGDQTGAARRFRPTDGSNTWGTSAGDLLKVCRVGGSWAVEGSAGCPTSGGLTNSGPGGSSSPEFYHWDIYDFEDMNTETLTGGFHWEITQGGLLQLGGRSTILTTAMDPAASDYSGGYVRLENATGRREGIAGESATLAQVEANGGYTIYEGGDWTGAPPSGIANLAKANGLGDIEALTQPPAIEIGNYVWLDADNDGVQDAGESGVGNVTVLLYDATGTQIDSTQTADTPLDPVTHGTYLFIGLDPETDYCIVIDSGEFGSGGDLFGKGLTANGAGTAETDSNGMILSVAGGAPAALAGETGYCLTTGTVGASDHSFDFGFIPVVAVGNLVFNDANGDGIFQPSSPQNEAGIPGVVVELWSAGANGQVGGGDDVEIAAGPDGILGTVDDAPGGMLTDGSGCYLFSNLPEGDYFVKIPTGEFTSGEPLYGLVSSAGQGGDDVHDDNEDENGDDNEADGVTSNVVALADDDEPASEAGKPMAQADDNNTNLTVDFGFTCPVITVLPASLPDGTVGTAYSQVLSASGGVGPYSFAVTSGSLPAGLSLTGNTISGTPTSDAAATFTITATDDAGCPGTREYTVQPECPAISVTSTPAVLPSGTIGSPYSATIDASGGTGPYTFALKSGSSLPPGLSLATNGAITGTPTGPESVTNFTVVATDDYGCPGEATFSIGIDCNTLTVSPTSLPSGSVGHAYGPVNFSATGATGSVSWTLSSGTLPAGLTLSSGGVLSGTPTEGGSFPISVTGTDANNCPGSASMTLSVPVASISGTVYEDTDDDGDGDVVINVVTISLCDDQGDPVDNPNIPGMQDYVITTTDGTYLFENLVPGSYIVKETQPTGFLSVTELDSTADAGGSPADDPVTTVNEIPVNVADGELDSGNDFVEVRPLSIGNLVWCDEDIDGEKDAVEPGIDGVVVHLLHDANEDGDFDEPGESTPVQTDTTSGGGFYLFENLRSGNYQVVIPVSNFSGALATKSLSSPETDTSDNGDDNDDNGSQLGGDGTVTSSPLIVLTLNDEPGSGGFTNIEDTVDFGFVDPSTLVGIGNLVFIDNNGNGIYDGGDTPATDVTVELYQPGGDGQPGGGDDILISSTTTGSSASGKEGCYAFFYQLPGDYFVKIPAAEFGVSGDLAGLVSVPGFGGDVFDDDGTDENGIDNGDPAANGVTSGVINLAAGDEATGGQEDGKDASGDDEWDTNINYTVDLGFVPAAATVGLGNKVFIDGNANGAYDGTPTDTPVGGVVVELYLASAGPGSGGAIATTTTDAQGCYAFTGLTSGQSYIAHIPASQFGGGAPLENLVSVPGNGGDDQVDDDLGENGIDSGSPAVSGISTTPITLAVTTEPLGEAGADGGGDAEDSNIDYTVDFALANAPTTVGIGNLVFIDADRNGVYTPGEGVDGVTVELYASGQSTATPALASTATVNGGCYVFTGLTSGQSYFVHIPATEFQGGGALEGSYSLPGQGGDTGVDDGTDENGDDPADPSVTGVSSGDIALAVGAEPVDASTETGKDAAGDNGGVDANIDYTVDFGFSPEKVATFAAWQTDNPLGGANGPTDNPDGDIYNNALEYALCLKPEDGTPVTEPGGEGGFCAELNGGTGEVDAFFVRPEVSNDVTYTLQTATAPGDPTVWTDRTDLTPTVTSIGDGTETVRYSDLETAVGSTGLVRLKVEIAGDGTGPHHTQVWGWNAETLPAGCRSCSNPYAPKGVYSGTAVSGAYAAGVLTSTAGGDVASLVGGGEYYLEFIGGIYEGHRFDLNEGASTAAGIALDTASARNTLSPVPADLQGAYVLRAHVTVDTLLPADLFAPDDNPGTGDRLLLFTGGAWQVLWVYDQSGGIPPQWTDTGNATLNDVGSIIIEPCQGYFTHPRAAAVDWVNVGVVRSWDFACPLVSSYNLVGGGYPQDMSPDDRVMLRDASDGVAQDYFTSNANPVLADQLMRWLGDDVVGVEGYQTYYNLYVPSTVYDYWTDQTNSSLSNENASLLFEHHRSVFYDMLNAHDRGVPAEVWIWPAPWSP